MGGGGGNMGVDTQNNGIRMAGWRNRKWLPTGKR